MMFLVGVSGPRGSVQVIPLLGYQIVVSMGNSLSEAPSESGQPISISKNRSSYTHPDSGNLQEFRTVQRDVKRKLWWIA